MRPLGVVPVNPLANRNSGFDELDVLLPGRFLLQAAEKRSTMPFCSGVHGVMNSLRSFVARDAKSAGSEGFATKFGMVATPSTASGLLRFLSTGVPREGFLQKPRLWPHNHLHKMLRID